MSNQKKSKVSCGKRQAFKIFRQKKKKIRKRRRKNAPLKDPDFKPSRGGRNYYSNLKKSQIIESEGLLERRTTRSSKKKTAKNDCDSSLTSGSSFDLDESLNSSLKCDEPEVITRRRITSIDSNFETQDQNYNVTFFVFMVYYSTIYEQSAPHCVEINIKTVNFEKISFFSMSNTS
ncbi:hypothetical protein M0813_19637 [Anaeramoeba flamelloides]|uniref:Uncharacterized protein n=1 Tax=Anaeramoeba flamelloides TaxID=1746091 RepID=A0ABQ8YMU4_9EUKA|nr:hypothetical protein M0813_19637 [Anaeramoeba flamelloides]